MVYPTHSTSQHSTPSLETQHTVHNRREHTRGCTLNPPMSSKAWPIWAGAWHHTTQQQQHQSDTRATHHGQAWGPSPTTTDTPPCQVAAACALSYAHTRHQHTLPDPPPSQGSKQGKMTRTAYRSAGTTYAGPVLTWRRQWPEGDGTQTLSTAFAANCIFRTHHQSWLCGVPAQGS